MAIGLAGCGQIAPTAVSSAPRQVALTDSAGVALTISGEGTPGTDPAARIENAAHALEAQFGPVTLQPPRTNTAGGHAFVVTGGRYANEGETVHVFLTSDQGGAICNVRAPLTPAAKAALTAVLQRCGTELSGQPAPIAAAAATAGRSAASAATGPHAANWDQVQGVYFHDAAGIGAGGGVMITYTPILLLLDGTAFEIGDAALEDVDLAADRVRHPASWSRWQQQGANYVVTDSHGRSLSYALQDGRFFQAFPVTGPLSGTYEHVSGGGTSAFGGGMTIAFENKYSFTPDGRFTSGEDAGGTSPGVAFGRKRGAGGTYTASQYTLTLHTPDGRVVRRFVAYGSKDAVPHIDRDMLFIGDRTYSR